MIMWSSTAKFHIYCFYYLLAREISTVRSLTLMPSAHGPIFCRKELREKVGAKVRFFLVLSQRTRPIFCRKQLREKIGLIFSRTKRDRTRTDFLSELLCVTIIGGVPLLDDVTPIFSRTEVRAHGPIFCRKKLREKIGAILYRSKSQRTRTNFHSKIVLCALGITVASLGVRDWSLVCKDLKPQYLKKIKKHTMCQKSKD